MNDNRIYLSPPNVGKEEQQKVQAALASGWVAPIGPEVDLLEVNLASLFSDKHVLVVNSGTSALHLALLLSGIGSGDVVLIGTFTFAACANAVHYVGGEAVFMDSEQETWNLDPVILEEYVATQDPPKALIVTHLYGVPAKMDEIRRICSSNEIILIEDAAEAVGSKLGGRTLGGLGDYGIFSFNGNKIITSSGGGALITNRGNYEHGLHLATQANDGKFEYNHTDIGYNYRLSNVSAAIGNAQFEKLDAFVAKKRSIFEIYKSELPKEVFSFPDELAGVYCNRWLTTILLNKDFSLRFKPMELIQFLDAQEIESRALWKPLHLHPAYCKSTYLGGEIAESLFNRGLCLPSGTNLSEADLEKVIEAIIRFTESV